MQIKCLQKVYRIFTHHGQLGAQLLWRHKAPALCCAIPAPEVCHARHHAPVAQLLASPARRSSASRFYHSALDGASIAFFVGVLRGNLMVCMCGCRTDAEVLEGRFRQGLQKGDLQMRVSSWRCLCLMLYLSGGT